MRKNIAIIPKKLTKGEELIVIPRSLRETFPLGGRARRSSSKGAHEIYRKNHLFVYYF